MKEVQQVPKISITLESMWPTDRQTCLQTTDIFKTNKQTKNPLNFYLTRIKFKCVITTAGH